MFRIQNVQYRPVDHFPILCRNIGSGHNLWVGGAASFSKIPCPLFPPDQLYNGVYNGPIHGHLPVIYANSDPPSLKLCIQILPPPYSCAVISLPPSIIGNPPNINYDRPLTCGLAAMSNNFRLCTKPSYL